MRKYFWGAPRVVNGAWDENPSLAIDDDGLPVIGHATLRRGKEKKQQEEETKWGEKTRRALDYHFQSHSTLGDLTLPPSLSSSKKANPSQATEDWKGGELKATGVALLQCQGDYPAAVQAIRDQST